MGEFRGRVEPRPGASGATKFCLLTPDTQRGTSCTIPPRPRSFTVSIVARFSVRSVTWHRCTRFYGLSRSFDTLMDIGARGMGELDQEQERVGRPSLALPRLILGEYRRYHCRQDIALSALTILIVQTFSVRSVTCMNLEYGAHYSLLGSVATVLGVAQVTAPARVARSTHGCRWSDQQAMALTRSIELYLYL
jgi:hypothetical protein